MFLPLVLEESAFLEARPEPGQLGVQLDVPTQDRDHRNRVGRRSGCTACRELIPSSVRLPVGPESMDREAIDDRLGTLREPAATIPAESARPCLSEPVEKMRAWVRAESVVEEQEN